MFSNLLKMVLLILFVPNFGFSQSNQSIDLSDQFPQQHKVQIGQTCYLNATIAALEAALNRSRPPNSKQFILDDEAMILQFLNFVLSKSPVDSTAALVREFHQSMIKANFLNLYGPKARPIDMGTMGGYYGRILLDFDLLKFGAYPTTLREATDKTLRTIMDKGREAIRPEYRGRNLFAEQINILTIFDESMTKSIFLQMKKIVVQTLRKIEQLSPAQVYRTDKASFKFTGIPSSKFDSQLSSNVGQASFTGIDPKLKTECSVASQETQQNIINALKAGIPLIAGVDRDGIEMGQSLDSLKRYPGTGMYHAMVITGIQYALRENGKSIPYVIFRDSGVVDGSKIARMPLTESCRIMALSAILTSHESLP